jgi:hypothetical protein
VVRREALQNRIEDLMTKAAKKRLLAPSAGPTTAPKPPRRAVVSPNSEKANSVSKQSRVIAMLQSPAGATIAAMMKATGWQQHSVRGFLAGVVRKRFNLNLASKKVDGARVYRIASADAGKRNLRQSKRQSA